MVNERMYFRKDEPEVYLDAYVLHHSDQIQTDRRRPAVIICPGGAYLRISDQEAEAVALRFAASGFHAFVLYYSVGEAARMPRPMQEIGWAISTVRDHAAEWYIDPDKVAVCGFSAGGHLCATASTKWREIGELLGIPPTLVRPDAALLCYPSTDLSEALPLLPLSMFSEGEIDPKHPERAVLDCFKPGIVGVDGQKWLDLGLPMNAMLLGTYSPTQAQLDEHSPYLHVTGQTPPAFVWTTANDDLLPPVNAMKYVQALMAHDVPVEFHMFGNGHHGLSLADHTTAPNEEFINPACAAWFPMAITWLQGLWGV